MYANYASKISLLESKYIHYDWRDSKLWILSESVESYNTNWHTRTHRHTQSPILRSYASTVWRSGLPSDLAQLKIPFPIFFKGSFAKWNTRQEPQQVDSRSAQETALGSGVKHQCLEMQHKAFQEQNLPVQEKCKLQLSRTDRLLNRTLWHPVALVKGNSTQSLPDVKCAPISAGPTNTKDFKHWPHWLEH